MLWETILRLAARELERALSIAKWNSSVLNIR
jgi:hypothetical protein